MHDGSHKLSVTKMKIQKIPHVFWVTRDCYVGNHDVMPRDARDNRTLW
jgi:hypothetical protein